MMADHVAEIHRRSNAAPVRSLSPAMARRRAHPRSGQPPAPSGSAAPIYIGGFPAADGTQVLSGFTSEATLAHSGDDSLLARDPALAALASVPARTRHGSSTPCSA